MNYFERFRHFLIDEISAKREPQREHVKERKGRWEGVSYDTEKIEYANKQGCYYQKKKTIKNNKTRTQTNKPRQRRVIQILLRMKVSRMM